MNIAVVFRSMTGHSKKIAKAIASELQVEVQNIKSKPTLTGVDLLFLVGGIYSGESLSDTLEYAKTLSGAEVKNAVLITSSTSNKKGQDGVRKILESNGVIVDGEEYRCFGNFLFVKIGRPNKKEIATAVEFAKRMVEKYKGG